MYRATSSSFAIRESSSRSAHENERTRHREPCKTIIASLATPEGLHCGPAEDGAVKRLQLMLGSLSVAGVMLGSCGGAASTGSAGGDATQSPGPGPATFGNPQRVTIAGYDSDAMEPFLSRDGSLLFFNGLNTTPEVDLFWATRLDDLTFQFNGQIAGVNGTYLSAVASMDRNRRFYFVSNRSYAQTASTLYSANFSNGALSSVALVPGVSVVTPGIVNFDAEISADGNTLYFVESNFGSAGPQTARILIARMGGSAFVRATDSATIMQNINTNALNYAPSTTSSELELFFTRLDSGGPAIYTATRGDTSSFFGQPQRISAITGFAEAPTVSPDARSLYYHYKDGNRFVIYRVTRP